jgi:uncharacterized membrane protein YkoI
MLSSIRKAAIAAAALAAMALGGAAIAGAAGNAAQPQQQPGGRDDQLSGSTAAKVKAAALAKVPGATVLETESGGPYGTAYHAHVKTTGGKLEVVLVDQSFKATAVQADRRGAGGPRGGRRGGPGGHSPEKPLTGDTKSKVEAAVRAKYPGATIVRTETNTDGSAPYESHIKTSDGKELEVHVSKDFAVVA